MSKTDEKIKTATMDFLIKEGKFDVTTQEIAERCGTSRTIIHYYFRSREQLMALVFDEIVNSWVSERYNSLFTIKSLKSKAQHYIEESSKILVKYPYLDIYIISHFDKAKETGLYNEAFKANFVHLKSEISEAIVRKEIPYTKPLHFLADLFSLTAFPYIFFDHLCQIGYSDDDKETKIAMEEQNKTILNKLFLI